MWIQYPNVPTLNSVEYQYLIGSDLLVKPVTSAGARASEILFLLSDCWYDVDTMKRMELVSIDGKVGSDSKITVSCYLYLCLSIFNTFSIVYCTIRTISTHFLCTHRYCILILLPSLLPSSYLLQYYVL